MSVADPLVVPETEVVVSVLKSMQSQITAAHTLLAFLRARRKEANYAVVEEQLNRADAHLREAVKTLRGPASENTAEISPNPLDRSLALRRATGATEAGASLTLRERGDILSRALQGRKLNHPRPGSAENDPM